MNQSLEMLAPIVLSLLAGSATGIGDLLVLVFGEINERVIGFFMDLCGWAWDDIYKDVQTLRFHGDFQWFTEEGASVNCCTDGLRPVVFRVERID